MPETIKQISTKNTKSEILEAYEALLKEITEKKSENPKVEQQRKADSNTLKRAENISLDGVVKDLATLKLNLAASLDELEKNMTQEYKKLSDLQEAIKIEQEKLQELYEIRENADSLAALILAQKQKKEAFELEISELKTTWEKEKTLMEAQAKEAKEKIQKDRKREEEEYQYERTIKRKKETDSYEQEKSRLTLELTDKKASFEKEITEREARVSETEQELKELRAKNAKFPNEMEDALAKKEQEITEKLTRDFDFEKKLSEQQNASSIELKNQTIETLEAKIKEQDLYLKELSSKSSNAENTVKEIALKALEIPSKLGVFQHETEKATKD